MQTGEAIAKYHNIKVIPDKRLREFDAGDFTTQKLTYKDWAKYSKSQSKKLGIKLWEVKTPNGESEYDPWTRVEYFILEILKTHKPQDNIVLIGHGGTNKNLLSIIGHMPKKKRYLARQGNTCLNELIFDGKNWTVSKVNCILHLKSDKQLVSVFEKIRDKPLDVIKNRCWEKSKRLKNRIEHLNYQVKYGLCSFKWSKQKFTKEILDLPHKDLGYHLFLWVKVNGTDLIVDSSNDKFLPEYNIWNGLSDCKLGVIPEKIFDKEKNNYLKSKEKIENESSKEYPAFYNAINKFLDNLRKLK